MHVKDAELTTSLSTPDGAALDAAVYARFDSALGAARYLGPLGNYLVARPAARHEASDATERTGLPLDAAVVLGVAGDELHVWQADPMLSRVGDHLGAVALRDLRAVTATPGKAWWDLRIASAGGEEVELQARGDVRSLADRIDRREAAGTA